LTIAYILFYNIYRK